MLTTLLGIVILVRPSHPKNAPSRMLVTLSGIVTLVSLLAPKASEAMHVTLSGML